MRMCGMRTVEGGVSVVSLSAWRQWFIDSLWCGCGGQNVMGGGYCSRMCRPPTPEIAVLLYVLVRNTHPSVRLCQFLCV